MEALFELVAFQVFGITYHTLDSRDVYSLLFVRTLHAFIFFKFYLAFSLSLVEYMKSYYSLNLMYLFEPFILKYHKTFSTLIFFSNNVAFQLFTFSVKSFYLVQIIYIFWPNSM